jgi:hypothetical protein
MGIFLSISRSIIAAHRGVSERQPAMGQDAPSHSPFQVTKVPNPLRNNDLRGTPEAGNRYLSTMDTGDQTADDWVVERP